MVDFNHFLLYNIIRKGDDCMANKVIGIKNIEIKTATPYRILRAMTNCECTLCSGKIKPQQLIFEEVISHSYGTESICRNCFNDLFDNEDWLNDYTE